MTRNELIRLIEDGSDIMLNFAGKRVTILTWTENGISIAEQHTCAYEKCYPTAKKLVDDYEIEGIRLKDHIEDIRITDYS